MDETLQLLLGPMGTLVLSLIIIWSILKRKWVPGWLYDREHAEKEEWKQAALRGTYAAEKAVDLAVRAKEVSDEATSDQ